MALNPEEQEIVNKIKLYARTYGLPVGLGVFLVLAATVGWNIYQNSRLANLEQATYTYQRFTQVSDGYNQAASELEISLLNEDPIPVAEPLQNDLDDSPFNVSSPPEISPAERATYLRYNLAEIADVLREDHPSSTYASFATLRVAAIDLMNNNLSSAIEGLTWVIQKSPSIETSRLAGLMLGRALVENKNFSEALSVLSSNKMGKLETAAISELLGDIYYKMQEHEKALSSYNKARGLGANTDIINYKISLLPINKSPVTN